MDVVDIFRNFCKQEKVDFHYDMNSRNRSQVKKINFKMQKKKLITKMLNLNNLKNTICIRIT